MLSLEVRNEGPSHSSPWFSGRKKIEWRELLGLHHWAESPWKGQHTGAGSLLRVFHVTEVAWDAFKRGLLLLQGRARAKPTTWAEKARGRRPRPDQQSAGANGLSLVTRLWALIRMSQTGFAHITRERSSCARKLGRWRASISWPGSVSNNWS